MSKLCGNVNNGNVSNMVVVTGQNTLVKSNTLSINSMTVPMSISPSTTPLQIQPKPVVTILQQTVPNMSIPSQSNAANNLMNPGSRLLPTLQQQNTFSIQPTSHFISNAPRPSPAPITFTLAPIAAKQSDLTSSSSSNTATNNNIHTNFAPIQMRPTINNVNNSTSSSTSTLSTTKLSPQSSLVNINSTTLTTNNQISSTINTPIGTGGIAIASSNGYYREWILEAIDKLRERKARPDADRISTLMKRYHNIPLEDTVACLSKLADTGAVVCVDYKGNISYRNPYKWRKNSANGGGIINPPSVTIRLLEAFKYLDRTRVNDNNNLMQNCVNHKVGYSISDIEQALQRTTGPNVTDMNKLQLRHCLEREATYGKLIRRPDNTYIIDETGEKKARKTTAIQARKPSITSTLTSGHKPILNKSIAAAPMQQTSTLQLQQQPPPQQQLQHHNPHHTMMNTIATAHPMITTTYTSAQPIMSTIFTAATNAPTQPSPILPKQGGTQPSHHIAFVKYEPMTSITPQQQQPAPIVTMTTQPPSLPPPPMSINPSQFTTPPSSTIHTNYQNIEHIKTSPTTTNTILSPPHSSATTTSSTSSPTAAAASSTTTQTTTFQNNNNLTKNNRRGRPPGSKNKRFDSTESNTQQNNNNNNNHSCINNNNTTYNNSVKKAKLDLSTSNYEHSSSMIGGNAESSICSINSITNSDQTVPAIGSVIDLCSECKLPQTEFEKFLYCRDCPIKVHPSCLHYWPELTERARLSPWQCSACKTCSICNDKSSKESVYICDGCDKGFHSNCHNPKIQEPISRNSAWICCNCYNEGFRIRTDESVKKVLNQTSPSASSTAAAAATIPSQSSNPTTLPLQSSSSASSITNNNNNSNNNNKQNLNHVDNNSDKMKIKKENCLKIFSTNKENERNEAVSTTTTMKKSNSQIPRPNDVTKWTVDHVCDWLIEEGFGSQSISFREQEIDGACLLLMKRIDVLTELNIKLGPAVKIYEKIKKIQNDNSIFKVEEF